MSTGCRFCASSCLDLAAAIARAETAESKVARVAELYAKWRDRDYDGPGEWTGYRRDACEAIEGALKGTP